MTSIEPESGWTERLNPRNWTLSWKLAVVGLVPALLALGLGVMRIADDAEQASELSRSSRLVEVRDQVAGAANALRQERDESAVHVAGDRTGDPNALQGGFGQADTEIDEMLNVLRGTGELDPATVSAQQRTEDSLGRLVNLRASVLGNPPVPYDQVVTRYTDIIGPIDALDRALLRQLRTPATAGLADTLTAVTGSIEQLSIEHTVLGAAIRAGQPLPGDPAVVNAANAQLNAYHRDYQASLTPEQLARFGNLSNGSSSNARLDQLRTAILAAPYQLEPMQKDWDAAYGASRAAADRTAEQVRGELVATSTAAEDRAGNLAGLSAVLLLLGLLIGITIAVLVSRALVRSLRILRTSALDVAERRLPQTVESVQAGETPDITIAPVPLTGRDEVVQVARAFDTVHRQAIKLAADQAALQAGISAMFVNLSRRSQALVERQLQLIEQLENNEQDADQLSNLFQLDHLATRMRRNSENLLVLAGTDVAKRNVASIPMVDVLRAAVSEVDQYQRIVVQAPPTVTILGRTASDLVHLLAELLDNATNFSPPDSQVVMSSTRTADGAIVVEIADRGVGMTDDELDAANTRLSGPVSVDVSTSRRMGLFVVGRLAARHGVDVRLSSSAAGSGLTASVTVPTTLVPTGEPRRAVAPAASSSRKQLPAGGAGELVPQRPGRNGAGRAGSLSALVSGVDGPGAGPAGPPVPYSPLGPGPTVTPGGTVNGLPSRQPGSSLRPAGPTAPTEHPEPGATPDREGSADPVSDRPRTGPAVDRPGNDRPGGDRPGDDRPGIDRPTADRPGFDRLGAGQPGVDRPSTDRPSTDRPGTDRPMVDRPRNDRARDDNPFADRPDSDRPMVDRPDRDRPDRDRPAAGLPDDDRAGATADPRATAEPGVLNGMAPTGHQESPDAASDTPPSGIPAAPWPARESAGPAPERSRTTAPGAAAANGNGSGPDHRDLAVSGDPDPELVDPDGSDRPERRPIAGENGTDSRPAPRTDPTPVVDRRVPQLPQRRPSPHPEPRPNGPRSIPRAGAAPGRPAPDLWSGRSTTQSADGLFASKAAPPPPPKAPYFDPAETTPIFEEIASAWFRSNRAVPVEYGAEQSEPTPASTPERAPSRPQPAPPHPFAAPAPPPAPAPAPTQVPVAVPSRSAAAEPAAAERVAAEVTPDHGFASLADEGWRAAEGMTAARGDELTQAGLPKRRPRERLVPGSAGSAVLAPAAAPARNADNVRGRLASYQQGVRMGRENRQRDDTQSSTSATNRAAPQNGTPNSGAEQGNHDEESS